MPGPDLQLHVALESPEVLGSSRGKLRKTELTEATFIRPLAMLGGAFLGHSCSPTWPYPAWKASLLCPGILMGEYLLHTSSQETSHDIRVQTGTSHVLILNTVLIPRVDKE